MSLNSATNRARPSLSVVIIAQDEERNIAAVLDAAKKIADEIVLVDSGSTDRTVEIARSRGARVLHQPWLGYAAQKNLALSQAQCQWILSLDADEILTEELTDEIESVLSGDAAKEYDGFKIARLMMVGERAVRYGGFYPDAQLRLFRAGKGRFNDRLVHESVTLDGRIHQLQHHLIHKAYPDLAGFAAAHDKYARLSAQQSLKTGYSPWKTSFINEALHPVWTFCFRFFARRGFLDGWLGLQMNLVYSNYVRKKICYLRQAIRKKHHEPS